MEIKEQTDTKRKVDDSSRNNHGQQQQPFKRHNVTKGSSKNVVFDVEAPGSLSRRECPKFEDKEGEIGNAQGWVYAVGNAEKNGNASKNPDSNVREILGYNTIILVCCTLNFLNHPFNIDLMPVELGSFDIINRMDWLRRCHAVIVYDEKLVRIPYGNETLIFCGDESNNGRESRLTIISCSKAQEYMAKGCQIFCWHR
ncbi:hypothetical protein Tco_0092793 [Tanacetum coccineum]